MSSTTTSLAANASRVARGVLPLYAATLFTSAFLLFWIQPLFGKMALPLLGGAPAVWNTSMLFFQVILLGGYAYAHLSARMLSPRVQAFVHVGLFAIAVIALPIALPADLAPPFEGTPIIWLLGVLAATVGLPFFALAGSAPLLQRWFSNTGHKDAQDPYFLYGASNLGSLLALLGYPFILEPLFGLGLQGIIWAFIFGALVILIILSAMGRQVPKAVSTDEPQPAVEAVETVTWARRGKWLALSLVPSSLLLGVTTHITTDVAAAPLLWVLPLALYLLTFVFVFARRPVIKLSWMLVLQPPLIIVVALSLWLRIGSVPLLMAFHLAAFFVTAMVCHTQLADDRPGPTRLTEFYLFMSLGGALGGFFNAILAPVLFDSILEYPMVLVAAMLLRPWQKSAWPSGFGPALKKWIRMSTPATVIALLLISLPIADSEDGALILLFTGGVCALFGFFAARASPFWLALMIAFLAFVPLRQLVVGTQVTLRTERSFFGVYQVNRETTPVAQEVRHNEGTVKSVRTINVDVTRLEHGTTLHGAQIVFDGKPSAPSTYYSRTGPFGKVLLAWNEDHPAGTVASVGLGIGTSGCYVQPGQTWTFYEIDPVITNIARDPELFTLLSQCAPDVPVIHGDARLKLRDSAPGSIDFLILDAFSSDAVPVHLLTVDAVEEYKTLLAENGLLFFHITNRHLDLDLALGRIAEETGMVGRVYRGTPGVVPEGEPALLRLVRLPSIWVLFARTEEDLAVFDDVHAFERLEAKPGQPLWTDDHSDIISVIRW